MNEPISTISNEKVLKYASKDEYDKKYNDYLKDIIFLDGNSTEILKEDEANDLKKNIMTKSFTPLENYFTIAYNEISKVLPTNTNIEKKYKKNTKVEINISKVNDLDSDKDEWIPGVIVKLIGDDNNIIYTVKIDDSVDITKYKNIDISNKTISVENKNFIHFPDWRDCIGDCYTTCHAYVENEVVSTAYMLRTLTASVLGNTSEYKICFSINVDVIKYPSTITGKWKDDQKIFQIEICKVSIIDGKTTIINYDKPKNGRFILGAGPSASGKTYNAGLIIEMMKMVDSTFPTFFMTIDGGTYRENSVIYQTIVDVIKNKNQYPGLNNLMSASIFSTKKTIFETDSIKKVINDYLLEQKEKEKFVVSLYVPDTLTYCGLVKVDCIPKLKIYIEITGDNNWIGLMIYQHKTGGDGCPFKSGYKCVGCTESGKTREKTEGKKYSSAAWNMSYEHGLQTIQKAPNFRFVLHNGGKRVTPSVFEDLSQEKISYDTNGDIQKFFNDKNIKYINGELIRNNDCDDYLLKGCEIHKTPQVDQHVVRIDEEFVNNYSNKYIAIPKKLIDIPKIENFDNMDDETVALLLMIQKFIKSGFFLLSEMDTEKMDETERDYNYYRIVMDNFNYYEDYEDFESLLESDEIKIYEKETKTDAKKETKPSAFGSSVFNFLNSASLFSGDKSKINEEENQKEVQKLEQVINDNPQLENDIKNADVVSVDDIEISQKIKDNFGKDESIKIFEKMNEETKKPITIVNVTGDKRPLMNWFSKTIQQSVKPLTSVFINKELVEPQGEAQSEAKGEPQVDIQSETQDETPVQPENVPLPMTLNEVVNNNSSKKRYIGIPKTLEKSNENEENTLNYLKKENVITKIDVTKGSLNKLNGYDEELYDYYELNVDEFIKSKVEDSIRMAKLELTSAFETLSKNNTLYIYENQPETKPTIGDEANNKTASSFFGNILGTFTGKKQGEPEEEPEEEKGDKTNDKPPKCKKNRTAKKSSEVKTSNTNLNNTSRRSSGRLKDKEAKNYKV